MDDHRSADALTESAIDREIEIALAVDPSPEFVARVRARVASGPAPSRWGLPSMFAAAGVVAMIVLIAVAVFRSDQQRNPASVTASVVASVPTADITLAPLAPAVAQPAIASAPSRRRSTSAASGAGRPVRSAIDAEVLISADEARALRRLFAGVREGRIDLSIVPEAPTATAALGLLSEIAIPPITLEPVTAREGELQ